MSDGTILIVDDEKMIRDLLVDMLSEAGDYEIQSAINGKEALEICENEEIDLVFTDLRMPVMTGMEFLAEVRDKKPDIPVVILTGYGRREDVIEALRLGASNFLMKPQEVELVHSIANKILRMRYKERLEQRIFEHFIEEKQVYHIPSDPRFTLPLIDLLTEKINKIGICTHSEFMNIRLALDEALVNAIIHGNLEVPSRVKGNSLDELMEFNQMVKERSGQGPYAERKVKVVVHLTQEYASFCIEDEGNGFDWKSSPTDLEDVELLANHGRGLFLIRAFMSCVEFNEKGNEITLIKKRSQVPGL
jgi:CheY-like chemotaxis protein/anti-sigma regulatory factor (Ser/Thr protein kinase)